MEYTDGLFEFPIKVYDGFSVRKALKQEEEYETPMDGDWIEGFAEIPFTEIKGIIDYFSKGRTLEEVAKEGFDSCIVMTHNYGDFVANISRIEFRKRLNAFASKYANEVEDLVAQKLREKEEEKSSIPEEKRPWWKKKRA